MSDVNQRTQRILLVQAGRQDLGALRAALTAEAGQPFELEWAGQLDHALARLSRGGIDVLLLDLHLPDSDGLVTFERAHAFSPDVPIVVLTDVDDMELGTNAVKLGAHDFLVKGRADASVLVRAIRYAVERHRLMEALKSLSLVDDLTGLYNRKGFSDLGNRHLKLARRTSRGLLLVYCDLDHFKAINDTLGHHVGDRALLKLTDILKAAFRSSDIVARLGGDEFAVLALEVSGEDENLLVRRLRDHIHEFNAVSHEPYTLSVSIGTARLDYSAGRVRLDDLLAQADAAMYEEKRSKRKAVLP
jgi:two-component system cell cycle response regulator